jgi:hypothetical protein
MIFRLRGSFSEADVRHYLIIFIIVHLSMRQSFPKDTVIKAHDGATAGTDQILLSISSAQATRLCVLVNR